jgi:uncharacterized protein with NAD-binding domain and iron-sulfur cluster
MAKVIVIGGGVGGLTVAHELAERGLEVHVYEARSDWGGKARSQFVAGTGTGGRRDLPGEHGFRFYPSFYRHVIDTMARIPVAGASGGHVADRLRPCAEGAVALINGKPCSPFPRRMLSQSSEVLEALQVFFQDLGFDPTDIGLFNLKVLQFLSSSDERRLGEYEGLSWYQFLGGDGYSPNFQRKLTEIPRMLVAMDSMVGNARTNGCTSMQLFFDYATTGTASDRTMGGPTSQMWIDPWTAHLQSLGVQLHPAETCVALDVAGGRVSGARFAGGAVRTADHYVLAVPIEAAIPLMSEDLAALDPQCDRLRRAEVERLVSWMVGIQFFLRRDVPLARGHIVFPDSPWALTAISQPQFWRETVGEFSSHYGDGQVAGLISVDISEWARPGTHIPKPARECTRDEVFAEVWWQLKAALNGTGPDQQILTDEILHSWHLDTDVDYSSGLPPRNRSALLIHPPGSWAMRPEAAGAVPNLCFAADYVRTHTDIASMEAACEAGRRAANAILERERSAKAPARIWPLEEPAMFDPWKRLDADLYRAGRPHLFETLGIRNAFAAVDLFRRFSALSGIPSIDILMRQFKVTEMVGGLLSHFWPGTRRP